MNPEYKNGKNLGEACVTITAFVTEKDREKIKPKKISKKTCISDGDVKSIEKRAENKAKIEALINFDSSLSDFDEKDIIKLLKSVNYSDSGMVDGTTTYCIKATGSVNPIEIKSFVNKKIKEKNNNEKKKSSDNKFSIIGVWEQIHTNKEGVHQLIQIDIQKLSSSKKSATIKYHHPSKCYINLVFSFKKNNTYSFHGIDGHNNLKYKDITFSECSNEILYSYIIKETPSTISIIRKYGNDEPEDIGVFKKVQ